jgi:hypothetical protein
MPTPTPSTPTLDGGSLSQGASDTVEQLTDSSDDLDRANIVGVAAGASALGGLVFAIFALARRRKADETLES